MLRLRRSRGGLVAAATFLTVFFAMLCWLFLVASKNPADSGESGILLLPFAMPWVLWIPQAWVGPGSGMAAVSLNAVIVYLVFGGLRWDRDA